MKDKPQAEIAGKKVRRYEKPALKFYGSVSTLTSGIGSDRNEEGGKEPGTPMRTTGTSDRALKSGIVKVGAHPLGIGLYLFDFKPEFQDMCGHGRQFGVMADEVEEVLPEAVSIHSNGYKMVDYGMLGIRRDTH